MGVIDWPVRQERNTADLAGCLLARCLHTPDMVCPPLGAGWTIAAGALHCGVGAQRLGGLFEVFFESYWAQFTSLRRVEWRCQVAGTARITLWRRDAVGGTEQMVGQWLGTGGVARLACDLALGGESSLHIAIDAADGAVLSAAGWYAPTTPPRAVRLGLTMTTYQREPFVRANLARLAGQMVGAELVIVNHGAPGLAQRLADAVPAGLDDHTIRIIDQENSGGAGGATRGMLEHARAGRVTHVLIMDDDIDLPADLVERVAAVLAWADRPICVGGAMFDYHDRTRLFSAGDFLEPGSFAIGQVAHHDCRDVGSPRGVDFLARMHAPDFNGWWCFAFPLAATDVVGLPMPCFIRGDDVEFGYRLKQAGWPTLGWPGIAVWHMPFADKSAAWQMFYDRRNSLFTNALHRRVGRRAALGKLLGGFFHHLLRHDYDRVAAMTQGIAAFNQGGAAMAAWGAQDHTALLAQTRHYARLAAGALADAEATGGVLTMAQPPVRLRGLRRALTMTGRLLLDMGVPRRRGRAVCLPPGAECRPDDAARPDLVVTRSAGGTRDAVFAYDFATTWLCLWRYFRVLTVMAWRFHANLPQTREGIPIIAPSAAGAREARQGAQSKSGI